MSSIPNNAMPHAVAEPTVVTGEITNTLDRLLERTRAVPTRAWVAGAAALGVAAAAATASLWNRPRAKTRVTTTRRAAPRRKTTATKRAA